MTNFGRNLTWLISFLSIIFVVGFVFGVIVGIVGMSMFGGAA